MGYNQSNGGVAALDYVVKVLMGKPYRFGGDYPPLGTSDGTDCSGLFQNAYNHIGVTLTRITETQCSEYPIPTSGPFESGDGLFFAGAPSDPPPGHVGMYVGIGIIGWEQHSFLPHPNGQPVLYNAPYTGDPFGIRYDYLSGFGTILYATRPALALPAPPQPPPTEDLDMAVITQDPINKGMVILDPNTGHYYGIANPEVEKYYTQVIGVKVVAAPSPAVFAKFTQDGTI